MSVLSEASRFKYCAIKASIDKAETNTLGSIITCTLQTTHLQSSQPTLPLLEDQNNEQRVYFVYLIYMSVYISLLFFFVCLFLSDFDIMYSDQLKYIIVQHAAL